MEMTYAIKLLEGEKVNIERSMKSEDLMRKDMKRATTEFRKITEIKMALKLLKSKRTV